MKKLITLLSLAAAPVLFAQEQKVSSQELEHMKEMEQKKQEQMEAQKKANPQSSLKESSAEKSTKAEIKATKREKRNASSNTKALKD